MRFFRLSWKISHISGLIIFFMLYQKKIAFFHILRLIIVLLRFLEVEINGPRNVPSDFGHSDVLRAIRLYDWSRHHFSLLQNHRRQFGIFPFIRSCGNA